MSETKTGPEVEWRERVRDYFTARLRPDRHEEPAQSIAPADKQEATNRHGQ